MNPSPHPGRGHDTDETVPPRYLVNVLGPFDLWHGDRDVTPAAGRPSELVQLLAINGGRLHREQVIDALWPNEPLRIGLVRLRNVVSRCRAGTGPLIDRHRELLMFSVPHRIDLAEFLRLSEHAIRHADRDPTEALRAGTQALMLHRGPVLQDHPYAEWAQETRRQIEHRRELLLEALAEASERLGDPFGARLCRQLASIYRWRT